MKTNETNVVTEQKFKHGDKIKYIHKSCGLLTKHKVYTFDCYNEELKFIKIKGNYDNGSYVQAGVNKEYFVLAESVVKVKPKDQRKKYTLVYNQWIVGIHYLPKIKKIKVKDITAYLKKTGIDVQYVIKGHVTLV